MFLGDDPIRLSRRPDGTFDVIGGRHRIQVARQLGIGSLPARVMN
jgi:ParB-like chromosome segregation protein Spo0J